MKKTIIAMMLAAVMAAVFVGWNVDAAPAVEAKPVMACQAKARAVDGSAVVGWLVFYNSIGCPNVTVEYIDGTNWFLRPVLFD